MQWCLAEPLGIPIIPPFVNGPENRSKTNLKMVLDQFPLNAERYRCRDVTGDLLPETFCNFFTRDVARAMSAPLPENKTANEIHGMLHAGSVPGYRQVTEAEAVWCLELGQMVVCIARNEHGPGHMTPAREASEGTIYVDHVGRHNAKKIPLEVAFGPLAKDVEYWIHK